MYRLDGYKQRQEGGQKGERSSVGECCQESEKYRYFIINWT